MAQKIKTYPRSFNKHLVNKYGKPGSKKRIAFEEAALADMIADLVKDARKRSGLTQTQLAEKLNTKRTYISRIERARSDIRLTTLRRIIEDGLGGKLTIGIEV